LLFCPSCAAVVLVQSRGQVGGEKARSPSQMVLRLASGASAGHFCVSPRRAWVSDKTRKTHVGIILSGRPHGARGNYEPKESIPLATR
jgi:hypothetical protein